MIIRDMPGAVISGRRLMGASLFWGGANLPMRRLRLGSGDGAAPFHEAASGAFIAASFPLGTMLGERDVSIEGDPLPLLIYGSHTLHARWTDWNAIYGLAPVAEAEREAIPILMRHRALRRKGLLPRLPARGFPTGCGICE